MKRKLWKGGEIIFSSLLNEANEYQLEEEVDRLIWGVTEQIVEQALKSMKVGKIPRPSGVTSDLIKAAGATGVKGHFQVCESIKQEGEVPEQWVKSYTATIPAYKGKGDILMVDKHRGVKLLKQDMKVYEKSLLQKRLRDIVKIDEKQFGLQSGTVSQL